MGDPTHVTVRALHGYNMLAVMAFDGTQPCLELIGYQYPNPDDGEATQLLIDRLDYNFTDNWMGVYKDALKLVFSEIVKYTSCYGLAVAVPSRVNEDLPEEINLRAAWGMIVISLDGEGYLLFRSLDKAREDTRESSDG